MADPSRTEQATPRRRAEARRSGQVARSAEVNTVLILLATLLAVKWTSEFVYGKFAGYMKLFLSQAHTFSFSTDSAPGLGARLIFDMGVVLAPLLLAAFLAAMVAGFGQAGFLLSGKPLTPQLNRINPIAGFQRIFSLQGFVSLIRSIAKVSLTAMVVYYTFKKFLPQLLALAMMESAPSLAMVGSLTYQLAMRIILVLLALSLLDYLYQRYEFEQSLRMTREEIKEELKQTEGDPRIRARIRSRQRQMAMRRMMAAVPEARVVITNPTHLAVALKWSEEMDAPQVVAKGAGFIAEKIKDLARHHRIPIVRDPPVAQVLYKTVDIGWQIPPTLYTAIARIIAFVYQIEGKQIQPTVSPESTISAKATEAVPGLPGGQALFEAGAGLLPVPHASRQAYSQADRQADRQGGQAIAQATEITARPDGSPLEGGTS